MGSPREDRSCMMVWTWITFAKDTDHIWCQRDYAHSLNFTGRTHKDRIFSRKLNKFAIRIGSIINQFVAVLINIAIILGKEKKQQQPYFKKAISWQNFWQHVVLFVKKKLLVNKSANFYTAGTHIYAMRMPLSQQSSKSPYMLDPIHYRVSLGHFLIPLPFSLTAWWIVDVISLRAQPGFALSISCLQTAASLTVLPAPSFFLNLPTPMRALEQSLLGFPGRFLSERLEKVPIKALSSLPCFTYSFVPVFFLV